MKSLSFGVPLLAAICLFVTPAPLSAQNLPPLPPLPGLALTGSPALAKAEEAYQKDLHDKVDAPADLLEKRLSDLYRASLESEAKKAIGQGLLDGAVAFQSESKRFAVENNVPEQDEPGTLAGLAKVRAAYRTEAMRVTQQRAAGRQAVLTAYLANLRVLEVELTKAAKLDDAMAVRKRSTELAALAPPPPVTRATPAPVAATPRPLVSTSALGPLADKVDLYVVGKETEVYVNKKAAGNRATREHPEQIRVPLHAGDVIAVHVGDSFKEHSFWLCGVTPSGEFLFETSPEWHAYLPFDRKTWWEIKKPAKDLRAQFVPGVDGYVQAVLKSASVTPCYRGALPIRSPIDDTGSPYAANFFYHVVAREDLAPKKFDPATRVDGTAAAQPFLGKTVRLATASDPTSGVVIEKNEGKIGPLGAAAPGAASFKVTKGSEPGTVHFESVASPGYYLNEGGNRGHLLKGLFPASNFWIEKASGSEGFVIAAHLHPLHHFASEPNHVLAFTESSKNGNDVFLIQEAPAGR